MTDYQYDHTGKELEAERQGDRGSKQGDRGRETEAGRQRQGVGKTQSWRWSFRQVACSAPNGSMHTKHIAL